MNQDTKQALVIGAGMAGTAVARALAERGWNIKILEKAEQACAAGSGVPVGVMSCHVSGDNNILSQLTREGLQWTRSFAQTHLVQGTDWQGNGVLECRLSPDGTNRKPWTDASSSNVWNGHVALATDEQLAQAGLSNSTTQTLWQAHGAWFKPQALVHALLKHDNIELITRAEVENMQRDDTTGHWTLRVKNHINIPNMGSSYTYSTETAPHVVLALGANTPDFLNQVLNVDHMGLHPISGVVSWGLQKDVTGLPPFAVNGHGSFVAGVPTTEGLAWYTGATFERNTMQATPNAQAHKDNQQRLSELLPAVEKQLHAQWSDPTQLSAWSGVRCASINRMPKVGPLDEAQFPGLHLLTAMGSRGLTLALLCAEVLAAQMEKSKPPVSESLLKAMRCQLI